MKSVFLIFIPILLMGCRKEGLDIKFRRIYTSIQENNTPIQNSKALFKSTQSDYTQFGELIGTITPKKVTAKFSSTRYFNRRDSEEGMSTKLVLISTNWPDNEKRFADFTDGNAVEMVPEIWGNVDNDGWFANENITFKYVGVFTHYFNFEFDLPESFGSEPINMQNIDNRVGSTIYCKLDYFLMILGPEYQLGGYVFGDTDSTYLVSSTNFNSNEVMELVSMAQPRYVADPEIIFVRC